MAQTDFFELFSLPVRFELKRTELDQRFRQLQALVHPDKYATASSPEQRQAAEKSMNINDAYQTLKDPIKRAMLVCSMRGVSVDLNTNTAMSMDFLIEQMELREALEALVHAHPSGSMTDAIESFQEKIELAQRARLARLNEQLDVKNDPLGAVVLIKELMFFNKLAQEADDAAVQLQN